MTYIVVDPSNADYGEELINDGCYTEHDHNPVFVHTPEPKVTKCENAKLL